MLVVTLGVLSKVLVISHFSSTSPLHCRASFPSSKFPMMRDVGDFNPNVGKLSAPPGY
jgi:hypothetical protein